MFHPQCVLLVLLLSESSSCSSPGYPASVPIHDLLDLERYHPSDLLFILQSIYTPVTHLLPVVHLRIVIKTSPYNISLCVCESFRNTYFLIFSLFFILLLLLLFFLYLSLYKTLVPVVVLKVLYK